MKNLNGPAQQRNTRLCSSGCGTVRRNRTALKLESAIGKGVKNGKSRGKNLPLHLTSDEKRTRGDAGSRKCYQETAR